MQNAPLLAAYGVNQVAFFNIELFFLVFTSEMSASQDNKVVLFAVDDYNSPFILKSCIALLKMKKLASFHLHLTVVTQDEEILSSLVVIKELNHRLFFHNTDLYSDESVQQTVHNVLQIEDRIDILGIYIFLHQR